MTKYRRRYIVSFFTVVCSVMADCSVALRTALPNQKSRATTKREITAHLLLGSRVQVRGTLDVFQRNDMLIPQGEHLEGIGRLLLRHGRRDSFNRVSWRFLPRLGQAGMSVFDPTDNGHLGRGVLRWLLAAGCGGLWSRSWECAKVQKCAILLNRCGVFRVFHCTI